MSNWQWATMFVVLLVPVLVLVGMVLLGWWTGRSLDKGEMRRGIAVFIIVTFTLLVAASFFPEGPNVSAELKGLFGGAVTTILGFYFGSRVAQQAQTTPESKVISSDTDNPQK
jgi:hypothetical protein